jgi:hypothetical protein
MIAGRWGHVPGGEWVTGLAGAAVT